MTAIFIKGLISVWPFIREMFFGNKKIKDIVFENKLSTFLLVMLATSVFLNVVTLGKIYEIALASRRANIPTAAAARVIENSAKPVPPPARPAAPVAPAAPPASDPGNDYHESTLNRLRQIYGDEK